MTSGLNPSKPHFKREAYPLFEKEGPGEIFH